MPAPNPQPYRPHRREVAGLATTGLERTVLDLCGAIASERERLALVARVLQGGRSTPRRLAACVARSPSVAGAARLSAVLHTLQPGYESGVEAELAHHLACAGLRPLAQHPLQLPAGRRIRVDLAFLTEQVAVEVDGAAFHLGPAQREADLTRDQELRALGWEVIRVTARQVREEPGLVVSHVVAILRRRQNAALLPA